jgi:hypothetical protein
LVDVPIGGQQEIAFDLEKVSEGSVVEGSTVGGAEAKIFGVGVD